MAMEFKEKAPAIVLKGFILHELQRANGGSECDVIEQRVMVALRPSLTDLDNEFLACGTRRVSKNFHWARRHLVESGLIRPDSRQGYWELTAKGRDLAVDFYKLACIIRKGCDTDMTDSEVRRLAQYFEDNLLQADANVRSMLAQTFDRICPSDPTP